MLEDVTLVNKLGVKQCCVEWVPLTRRVFEVLYVGLVMVGVWVGDGHCDHAHQKRSQHSWRWDFSLC